LKNYDLLVVCLPCNHSGPFLCCVILLWLFRDPDVICFLNVPQIVQGAGKSAVLNSLIGHPVLVSFNFMLLLSSF
jgi:hypothetical protein